MPYSSQRATSDGTLVSLAISIDYFDRTEIQVLFNDVVVAEGAGWDWVGDTDTTLSFTPTVPNLTEVTVLRTTDLSDIRHSLAGGAAYTDEVMDENFLQVLHIAQEARENSRITDLFEDLNLHGNKIVNVADGVADTDGANMGQMNAHSAEIAISVNAAAASAVSAAASAAAIALPIAVASGGTGATTAANARTALGLAIGSDVQAHSATLAAIAAQTEAANKVQGYSADNTPTLFDFKDEDDLASNSDTAVPSQQSVKTYVDGTRVLSTAYDSGDQTITAGGALTLAHSLGAAPKIVQCLLKCNDAGGDIGYANGDYVFINTSGGDGGSGSISTGVSIVPDATNLNIRYGSETNVFFLNRKDTGSLNSIAVAKWKFIVRAYA